MKKIDEKAIEKFAKSKSILDKGRKLSESTDFDDLEIFDLFDDTYDISAYVKDDAADYRAEVNIAPWEPKIETIIGRYHCECSAFHQTAEPCEHIIALLYHYNMLAESIDENDYWEDPDFYEPTAEEEFQYALERTQDFLRQTMRPDLYQEIESHSSQQKEQAASAKATDGELKNLLDYYVLQDRNRFCQEHGNGDVRLEPTLHLEGERESMELKIGSTQMYVVKDIRNLIENIKQMRYVKYGKKLAFTHSQSAFTRESTGIVNLLLEMDNENEYSVPYNKWRYNNPQMRRSCTLSPAMLDRLMDLYEGRTLKVDDQLTCESMEIPVIRENPRLPLRINGLKPKSKGADVEMDNIFMTEGSKQWYILWGRQFYICTKEYYERAKGFLNLMAHNRDQYGYSYGYYYFPQELKHPSFHLSVEDYAAFSTNILPMIQDIFNIQINNVDFSEYAPQEAVFHSYLDKVGEHIECRAIVQYGEQEYPVAQIATTEEAGRDIRREFEVRSILEAYFQVSNDGQTYVSDEEESMLDFLEQGLQDLEQVSEIFATDRFKNMHVIPMPSVTTGISLKGNLLDISWNVEGMSPQEVMDILADYKKKKKYHRLKTGDFLRMDENSLAVLSELCNSLHLTKEQLREKKAEVPLYRSLYLDSLMRENAESIRFERDRNFKAIVRDMRSMEDSDFELPQSIHANLRPYQEIGFQWLCTLAKYGFGGILADDMGLGKTLQILCLVAAHPGSRTLVVCPASLVYNWESECHRFYPDARVMAVTGPAAGRKAQIAEWENSPQDILITSYDLLKRDIDLYENMKFDYCVIDEAQYIKNASTQASKAVKSISCQCRFALTGTPVENRLGELWSIFEFLMPGYLFSYKRFKEELEGPIAESRDEGARVRLSRMVKPFILRRLKKDVLKELPDKIEEVVYARMEGEQEKLYRAREKQLLMMLGSQSEEEFKTKKLQILAELTGLRQLCCDPALVYENYTAASAKTQTCLDVAENAVSGGHKILLFSQFASMLERLQTLLEERGLHTFLLTGKTSKEERRKLVDRFQQGEADIFLISLKAGGTGLNLTAADMVIHYDPWWNLAAQNQATDRAHRIGQDNKVTVIRLIIKESIEERILKMQEDKQNLADAVISEEGVSMSGLDKEQLLAVLEGTQD